MNKQEFISLLETPDLLGKQHIPSLRNVAADFPYFQTAQILLAKALYNEKHYEFEKQLKHVSVMSPDRAILFRFIHSINTPIQQELVISPPSSITGLVPEPALETALNFVEAPPVVVDRETTHAQPVSEDALEATSSDNQTVEIIEPSEPQMISSETNSIPEAEPTVEVDKPQTIVSVGETHSFAEWLLLQQKLKMVPDSAPVETLPEVSESSTPEIPVKEEVASNPETTETPSIQEEIAQQVIRSNVNEFESILDKFIRENPRISRGKAEFYNPVNMAKQSVEENDEVVTETLANIYYKQGHHKKAIRVYEKLCLIYPHKMPYFASLIQKIKTENKD